MVASLRITTDCHGPPTPLSTLSRLLVVSAALEIALPLSFVHPIVDIARVAVAVFMT